MRGDQICNVKLQKKNHKINNKQKDSGQKC